VRFVGIDIGSERHAAAVVNEDGAILLRPMSFGEDQAGYRLLRGLIGDPGDCLVAMEASGHYWRNLFAWLVIEGFSVAVINPVRTRRFAEEELQRTKTDKVDALGIARFASQKRPAPAEIAESAVDELRELVRLRELVVQSLGDRVRNLHRALDLTFPEFTRHVRGLDTDLAVAILSRYPTAAALRKVSARKLAALRVDDHRRVGFTLAHTLIDAAKASVGQHDGEPYRLQVAYACQDIIAFRNRAHELECNIERRLEEYQVGKLLTTIVGVSTLTAARIIAETGDPARFRSAAALASYVGVVPRLHESGKRKYTGKPLMPLGNARLRRALWMPVLVAVRLNPWLHAYYYRLRGAGKLPKVAMIAAMRKLLAAVYSIAKYRRPFVFNSFSPPTVTGAGR
jgi:transposase